MIFSIKQKNIVKSLKIWNITIKSKVYSYKDFLRFIRQDENFILSCSPFHISKWRKEKEIFYVKDIENINFLYTSFIENKDKEILFHYIKWRLAVLGRLLIYYNIEKINIKNLFQFLFIEVDLEIINKLSYLFEYKEVYNLKDLKNFYKSCCNYNKQDKVLLNYLASIYKIDLFTNNIKKMKENKTENTLVNQIVKILSEQFDLPETIVRTYQKSLDKLKNYIIHKDIKIDKIEEIIGQYKTENNDIVFTIENIIRNKKTKEIKSNFLKNKNDFNLNFKVKTTRIWE